MEKMLKENARVLGRNGARELTMEEFQRVSAGNGTHTLRITGHPPILDAFGDFD
jgi:hypothetical protein